MSRWARLTAVALLSLLAACSSPSAPDPIPAPEPPPTLTAVTSALIDLTNAERTRAGLAPLRANERLMQAAQLQAEQVAAAGRLEHTLPDARYPTLQDRIAAVGYQWRAIGENLAFGQRDAAQAVTGWMESAGHRANILNTNFTEIGTASVVDANGRRYYVQVFGRPASSGRYSSNSPRVAPSTGLLRSTSTSHQPKWTASR